MIAVVAVEPVQWKQCNGWQRVLSLVCWWFCVPSHEQQLSAKTLCPKVEKNNFICHCLKKKHRLVLHIHCTGGHPISVVSVCTCCIAMECTRHTDNQPSSEIMLGPTTNCCLVLLGLLLHARAVVAAAAVALKSNNWPFHV